MRGIRSRHLETGERCGKVFGIEGCEVVDLLTHPDAMASIANYLKKHGWRPGISRKKAEKVIYHYNHSKYYVKAILKIADLLKS